VTPRPGIAVVIPTFQHGARLICILEELANQSLASDRFEVIVVDDCSTDHTVAAVEDLARRLPYRLRVMVTPKNDGPAAARNLGWKASDAPVIAFLDDDCTPWCRWLEAGLAAFEAQPRAGVIQGSTHLPEGTDVNLLSDWYVCRHVEGPTPFFEGGNLFFRRDVLTITGGFDEDIRWYGEDCAAGWRVLEAGFERGFSSEAAVTHPVEHRGFRWYIENGLIESRVVHCAAKHPGFRRAAFWRPWAYRREDPAFVAAVAAIVIGLRFRPALLLALPYLWWRRPSIRHLNFFRLCLQIPVVDGARIVGHVRGSIAHGVVVI
jgi:GT2 family glycosyltransferase